MTRGICAGAKMSFGETMDTEVTAGSFRLHCTWCGAPSAGEAEPCSSLSDTEVLLRYYSGTSRACNHQTWRHRRDLFDRAKLRRSEQPRFS